MDQIDIEEIIPHRYPFRFVDQVLELEPGKRALGIKNVTANEWFFQGHFPGYPIMPGVLVLEALAQLGAAVILSLPENRGKMVLFAGIDKVRFKREVKPGDQILLSVVIGRWHRNIGKGVVQATVKERVVAQAELLFALK